MEQDDVWHDFHERFIPAMADVLAAQVDPHYIVKIDEHVYIHELGESDRRLVGRPDVALLEGTFPRVALGVVATMEAPVQVRLPAVDIERVSFLQILDRRHRQLVTVIELLSPANKRPGPDREQYLTKRGELLASAVHFVELDLLRGGQRMPCDDAPAADYRILVSRAADRPRADLWPIGLRDPLPDIPIPLAAPDTDATLPLQAALHRVYDAARYGTYLYDSPPTPRLSGDDERWAATILPTGVTPA